jgi:predicted glycoside hydrolase/deacetylase ChbG (UPF0249 family)
MCTASVMGVSAASLVERMGHPAGARLLIISAAGLGGCHSMNEGVYSCLLNGVASSAALMVPCPWAREAAARYRGEDIGVALTVNAEFELYRWGPITHAPSLLDGDGGFPRTASDLWDHADLDEVRRECRAQLERAILWGFDVTHLTSHQDALTMRPEFFDVCLDLACEFKLPLRLTPDDRQHHVGFPASALALEQGVITPDWVLAWSSDDDRGSAATSAIGTLKPGVTDLQLHPAADLPELRSLDSNWATRSADFESLSHDGPIAEAIRTSDVKVIGYRELRELQRR